MKVGAPAVVVLAATLMNAAAAAPQATLHDSTPADLSWALKGGATHAARSTRILIAQKAVTSIDSLDRIGGAQTVHPGLLTLQPDCAVRSTSADSTSGGSDHTDSSHQHSAP